jgi:hypothetical protein
MVWGMAIKVKKDDEKTGVNCTELRSYASTIRIDA